MSARTAERWLTWLVSIGGPLIVTAVLFRFSQQTQRDFVFIYLGLVAVVAVIRGLWPALLCAAISFMCVDWFFVQPVYTFTIADEQDIVNLLAFLAVAGVVGLLASRRRQALLQSEALARQLQEANTELIRLNKEQAEAASSALRLARSEQQIKALQEADRLRRDLLANVSHELRTPLGTILTESTDLSNAETPAEARRTLQTIAAEGRRLKALVDDMLDMAVIESGALELDLVSLDVGDAIVAAADRLHRASPGREVDWNADDAHAAVFADWDRLGQILDNLLSNADRFAPPGTPLVVRASRETPGLVTIRVIDRGPGVSDGLRERIFDRFFRGESDGKAGSTGLGLAIVKGLVEAHAGTVAVEDGTEPGAVFRFTLPEAPAA
ncbi:MAG TPA: ATP-binding protein [Candidatus Dormibacteraeota bacterium]